MAGRYWNDRVYRSADAYYRRWGYPDVQCETPGITHERFRPRVTQVAKRLWGVYLFLTIILIGLLWAGPMDLYDAVNHALTCISTGGYSTKNASIAYWDSAYIEYIITIFMFIGATNITLIYFFFNPVGPRSYLRMKKHAGFSGSY